jgi:hypothetical protein
LYYCCTYLFPDLGLRYDSLPYSRNGLASRLPSRTYAGLKFSKNIQTSTSLPLSLFGTAKIHQKTLCASIFLTFFSKIFQAFDNQ